MVYWGIVSAQDYSPLAAYQAATDPDRAERTLVAWRLVRALMVLRGLCQSAQPLSDIEGLDPDPWRFQKRSYIGAVSEASALVPARTARAIMDTRVEFAVFPSPEPEALVAWREICQCICQRLSISPQAIEAIQQDPDSDAAEQLQHEILTLEAVLIDETITRLVKGGLTSVVPRLMEDLDLSPSEARLLTAMAMNATVAARPSAEQTKALMVLRLEDYITRAREAFDSAGELRGYKMMMVLQGASAVKDDTHSDLYRMVEDYEIKKTSPLIGYDPEDLDD